MLWWFERDGRKTRVEVLNLASGNYELHVIDGDGIERVEHFAEAGALAKRQQQIQDSLVSQGWKGPERWIG
jgi:hypothetical protein